MTQSAKHRRYVFTIHNYVKRDLNRFHKIAEGLEKHRYIAYGLEVAGTGTPHIQGYIELREGNRFNFLHKYFGFKKAGKILKFHIEVANGTAEENKAYTKKEGSFFEFGEPATQGSRTDLKKIKEAVKNAPKNLPGIVDELAQNHQQLKFAESLQRYYLTQRDPAMPPKVFWIYGQTGVGKTSLVYRNFTEICSVSDGRWPGTNYRQQECLLFDDFREGNVPFEQLLKITDRYPTELEYKGGFVPLNSPYIVFTSPESIEKTFHFGRENIEQLKRRVIEIDLDLEMDVSSLDLRNYPPQA